MSRHERFDPRWRRYVRFWGRRPDADIEDELAFHLEMRASEYQDSGMNSEAAHAAAMHRFGDVAGVRAACSEISHRQERRMRFTETLATVRQDVGYALRQIGRSPSFAIATVLTLALGIGANSALFSIIDAVLLRPLPGIREPDRLVEVTSFSLSYPAYRDFSVADPALLELAAFRERQMAVRVGDHTEIIDGSIVSGNYFSLLGPLPARGRLLSEADDRPGAPPVAVVSHDFWERALDATPDLTDRSILLNGATFSIVGVAPRGFRGTRMVGVPDVWVAMHTWPLVAPSALRSYGLERRDWSWLSAIGRLAPEASVPQVEAALTASAKRQLAEYPHQTRSNTGMTVAPAATTTLGRATGAAVVQMLIMLGAVVSIVLLIACANIANLLLARAARRQREIGVRLALGASRGRLVRQLVTESLVLATLGGAAGLGGAMIVLELLGRVSLGDMMSFSVLDLGLSGRVVAFTAAMAVLTGLGFGLAPAVIGSRPDVLASLRDGAAAGSRSRSILRDSLLVAQVALSLVLLIGAGLFVRSLRAALAIDTGFDTSRLAVASVNPSLVQYDAQRAWRYYSEATNRIAAIPGVRSVSTVATVPLTPDENSESGQPEGYIPRPDEQVELYYNVVGRDYFGTVGIPLIVGRSFEPTDRPGSPRVAIVNETFVQRYWPGQSALGKRLFMIGDTLTIVGVARDAKYNELSEAPRPHMYRLLDQEPAWWRSEMSILVRGSGDAEMLLGPIRGALRSASAEVPIISIGSFDDRFDAVLAPQRIAASLLGFFGLLALVVAAVGVSGVVAYGLSQRTREIGIRMALGARGSSVLAMIMRESLTRVALGVAIGIALAAAGTRIAASLLYGVSATDPLTFATTAFVLITVAAAAALLPARRATAIDPLRALRSE